MARGVPTGGVIVAPGAVATGWFAVGAGGMGGTGKSPPFIYPFKIFYKNLRHPEASLFANNKGRDFGASINKDYC